jgi:hypothetical protein
LAYITAYNLSQHSLGGAYLLSSAFIGNQACQDVSADILILLGAGSAEIAT